MLKDCLEIFKELYDEKGDKLVIDSYRLVEGSYVLVDGQGNIDILEVGKKDRDTTDSKYFYFAQTDYLSKLVDMNKPIDNKKVIHSNNYLSFFVKKENINPDKLTDEIIDNYYNVLLNPSEKYNKDKEKKKMYEQVERKYGKVNPEAVERNKKWIKENIYKVFVKVKKDKSYLKIFFKVDIEEYKKESEKYIIPNIYNNTQYNTPINELTFGLPNDNMGLNSKKPYLENKTRKNSLPYLISEEEVILQKKFFDYLMNYVSEGKNNVYLEKGKIKCLSNDEALDEDFSGYFLRIKKGKEVEVHDFDIVTSLKNKITGLSIDRVIPIDYGKANQALQYGNIEELYKLKALINEVYFNKFLTSNYFNEAKDIKLNDFRVKENLLRARGAFFNWFYKGDSRIIKQVFDRVSLELIKNSICNDYLIKAKEQFNLRYGILKYFGGVENMADILSGVASNLRLKINSAQTDKIESDSEYYFAVGQVASYLLSLNKSSKKMHSLINPMLNCKTDEKLKNEISKLFKKYNFAIKKDSKRFNNLKAMILGYVPDAKVKEDMLVAGYLYSSLIYEKGEENKNE
jgi:CRISPR-associated protein Csh1